MAVELIQNYKNVVNNNEPQPVEQPAFYGKRHEKVILDDVPDSFEKAPTGKKVGLGVASYLLPGLGQFINGDNKKGWLFLGTGIIARKITKNLLRKNTIPLNEIGVAGESAAAVYESSVQKIMKNLKSADMKNILEKATKKGTTLGKIGLIVFGLGYLGTKIWSIVDAVKNAKPNAKNA